MKPRGFTKRGHIFTRKKVGYLERVQIQGSKWNSNSSAEWTFYLNAGVLFTDLPEPTANRGFPGTHVYGRSSNFMEGYPSEFRVTLNNIDVVRCEFEESVDQTCQAIAAVRAELRDAAAAGRMLWQHTMGRQSSER
jgi:hypothetical protein